MKPPALSSQLGTVTHAAAYTGPSSQRPRSDSNA